MSQRPYTKFWHAEWSADLRLRACSLAERGAFFALYALMHQGDGRLIVPVRDAAGILGVDVQELERAVRRLVGLGLFVLDGETLTCPELVHQITLTATRSEVGQRGGNASRGSASGDFAQAKSASKMRVSVSVSDSLSSDSPQNPEKKRTQRPGKRAGERWQEVLGRAEYGRLREDPAFVAAWSSWIDWCGTSGAKAKLPVGAQVARMLNRALQDPATYVRAIGLSIEKNYSGVDPEWLKNASGGTNGHAFVPKGEVAALRAIEFGNRQAAWAAEQDLFREQ